MVEHVGAVLLKLILLTNMNYTILMSMLTGKVAKFKVSSIAINGAVTALGTLPSFYFTGGGLSDGSGLGAAGSFTYTTNPGGSSPNGNRYVSSGGMDIFLNQEVTAGITSGIIRMVSPAGVNGVQVGAFTSAVASVANGGGYVSAATIASGGQYKTNNGTGTLFTGTLTCPLFINGSVFGGGGGFCDVTFTSGAITSLSNFTGPLTSGFTVPNTVAMYNSVQGGTIGGVNQGISAVALGGGNYAYGTITYTALAPYTYVNKNIINSTSSYNVQLSIPAGGETAQPWNAFITTTVGAVSGVVTQVWYESYPETYNLTGVTLSQVGSYYSTPTVTCTNAATLLTANMVPE
jgi:hypothetical protein